MADSHQDRPDHGPFIGALLDRARLLSDRRENEITAGSIGERVLYDKQVGHVAVRKMPDDALGVLRVSVGGGEAVGGVYCVFRGEKRSAIRALKLALEALEEAEC